MEMMCIYFYTFSISMIVTGIFLPTTTMTVLPHLSTPECEKESIMAYLDCMKTFSSTPTGEECTAYCLTVCPGFEAGSGLRDQLLVSNMLCTFLPMHFLIQHQTACVMNSLDVSTSPCLINFSCKDVKVGYISLFHITRNIWMNVLFISSSRGTLKELIVVHS